VSGNLDDAEGGPSEDLTPAFKRRTVYGKVSRYKLDTYLQTFDFPSPNISAEKRFTTTVPLQRLFLMNSDFMQIEAEELAKRIAPESDNRSRIRKVYQLAYGRDPTESEIKLGLDYLHSEPLKEYEENKKKAAEAAAKAEAGKGKRKKGDKGDAAGADAASEPKPAETAPITGDAKPAPSPVETASAATSTGDTSAEAASEAPAPAEAAEGGTAPAAAPENAAMGMGMMDGVPGMGGRRGGPGAPAEVKYDPSAWGRYAKILLSSSEFLFID
jgi:hypothetical protein